MQIPQWVQSLRSEYLIERSYLGANLGLSVLDQIFVRTSIKIYGIVMRVCIGAAVKSNRSPNDRDGQVNVDR